jgi:CheY-like chemotaxis protein
VSDGRVTISWECRPGTGLTLVWQEAGGIPFANGAGPSGGGGTSLLAAVERELGGTVRRVLAPGGARVEIDLPARHVLRCLLLRAGRRALVIDDNVIIAADLAEMLVSAGLGEVVVASNAEDARRHLADGAFDVVFLDVMLGAERSDALLGQMADTRVVIVTGVAPEELPVPFRALPLLAKPYGPRDVAAVLDGDTAEPA